MPENDEKKPILDPERELPAPHDMSLDPGPKVAGLIEAEEKDGIPVKGTDSSQYHSPKNKRTFPLWIFPLIAFLIVLFAGVTYVMNMQKETAKVVTSTELTPTSIPTPTPDPTVDWQTYVHTDGLSISYPSSWKIVDYPRIKGEKQIHSQDLRYEVGPESFVIYEGTLIRFGSSEVYKTPSVPLNNSIYAKSAYDFPDGKSTTITINGDPAIINEFVLAVDDLSQLYKTLYVLHENRIYSLTTITNSSAQKASLTTVDLIFSKIHFSLPTKVSSPSSTTEMQAKACTMEAKLCPDGSTVVRTGPNCRFAACPGN